MRRYFHIGTFTCLLWMARWSYGQAEATASRLSTVQIGSSWSIVSPDYGQKKTQGVSIYGTLDLTRRWGIEGDIHRASIITPTRIGEDSYLLGPRYVFRHNRLSPYAKGLLGFGRFHYKYESAPEATFTYKIYVFGGGIDVRALEHVNVRAIDFEYQNWPGHPPSGLSPMVFSLGAAYAFR